MEPKAPNYQSASSWVSWNRNMRSGTLWWDLWSGIAPAAYVSRRIHPRPGKSHGTVMASFMEREGFRAIKWRLEWWDVWNRNCFDISFSAFRNSDQWSVWRSWKWWVLWNCKNRTGKYCGAQAVSFVEPVRKMREFPLRANILNEFPPFLPLPAKILVSYVEPLPNSTVDNWRFSSNMTKLSVSFMERKQWVLWNRRRVMFSYN